MRGKFITFEGTEGSGKSTQIRKLARYLSSRGYSVLVTREPGGTLIGERIRKILLNVQNKQMCLPTEMLLYMACRAQLVKEIIKPALAGGKIVISDRFLDATIAYQGYGGGLNLELIRSVGGLVVGKTKPDLTFLLDISTRKGLSRLLGNHDRIERRPLSYHRRVRKGYLELARHQPGRIKIIPVKGGPDQVHEYIKKIVDKSLLAR